MKETDEKDEPNDELIDDSVVMTETFDHDSKENGEADQNDSNVPLRKSMEPEADTEKAIPLVNEMEQLVLIEDPHAMGEENQLTNQDVVGIDKGADVPVVEPGGEATAEDPTAELLETLPFFDSALTDRRNDATATMTSVTKVDQHPMDRHVSVTSDRKKILLMEARQDRQKWIAQVPLPYQVCDGATPLHAFRSVQELPTSLSIISHLYGVDTTIMDGKETVENETTENDETAYAVAQRIQLALTDHDIDQDAMLSTSDLIQGKDGTKNEYFAAYHNFIVTLQDPDAASFVQAMRTFCRKVKDAQSKEEIAGRLQSYTQSCLVSIQSNALWRHGGGDEVKRSLDAFLYGQCYATIESKMWTLQAQQKEQVWLKRLNELQFVNVKHLEIACLLDYNDDQITQLLKEPMEALQSINRYYSPFDKLQRILAVYHGINHALSAAMNPNPSPTHTKKLPSADDVLPGIILTVLRAKPSKLLLNLEIVEDFSLPEYLRGEAGYAFTNLYGAVQFLQDLNEPKSLSISPDEFRKGLEACRKASDERLQSRTKNVEVFEEERKPDSIALIQIPPRAVRMARLKGEDVNLDWALGYQSTDGVAKQVHATGDVKEHTNLDDILTDGLPPGFTRSYSFLTTRPEDIRLSDLPKLLSEYKMLVHTTETLLGERSKRDAVERKARQRKTQNELLERVKTMDPSLLPMMNGKKEKPI